MSCGRGFCRTCLLETNNIHYCPECSREQVQRFASQMGVKPKKARAGKVTRSKRKPEPVQPQAPPVVPAAGPAAPETPATPGPAATSAPPRQTPPQRQAPAPPAPPQRPAGPLPQQAAAPAPPGYIPAPRSGPQAERVPQVPEAPPLVGSPVQGRPTEPEQDTTWVVPAAPPVLVTPPAAPAPAAPAPAAPVPPAAAPPAEASQPVVEADTGERPEQAKPEKKAKRLKAPRSRRSKGGVAEGLDAEEPESLLSPEERAAFWGEASAGEGAAAAPGEPVKDEYAPRIGRLAALKERKRERRQAPVAMQTPEEYEGERTASPSYVKAVLFGLLAGVVLAAGYAGFEWWRHSGRWIFGWVIGFAVGLVVVLASGRHFNLKLGAISAVIACASLALGQLAFSMLDVRFNNILPIKLPFMTLLNQGATELAKAFASPWTVMFAISGLVAFLMSFRPWPIRLQLSGRPEAGGVSARNS